MMIIRQVTMLVVYSNHINITMQTPNNHDNNKYIYIYIPDN